MEFLSVYYTCFEKFGVDGGYLGGTQNKSFKKLISNIRPMHNLMASAKEVNITNLDCLKIIKKYMKDEEACLFIDPPYIWSDGKYKYNAASESNYHKKIYAVLSKCKCKFVLFLRMTSSHQFKWQNQSDNLIQKDRCIRAFYDNRYKNKGYYKKEIPFDSSTDPTIECVITNFMFEGAEEY